MIESLKNRLIEAEHPVGIKKTSNWKLPSEVFAYGKKETPDKEGVSIVTRSWKVHEHSKFMEPPQDFIKINRLAIQNKAFNHLLNKNFRKSVDIKEIINKGNYQKKIYLPTEDFIYGKRNRSPTPIKNIINYDYSRKAEEEIKMEYDNYIHSKQQVDKLHAKSTHHFEKLRESRKIIQQNEHKPLYKMKMFTGIGSRVIEGIKNFKTYDDKNDDKQQKINKENLDLIIERIENELKDIDANEKFNIENQDS